MNAITDPTGCTITPFHWCGRQLGWAIWTPPPGVACIRVVYGPLAEARRQVGAWAAVNLKPPWWWRKGANDVAT